MVCRDFILPEPASYVFFYAFFNLRNLLYIIPRSGTQSSKSEKDLLLFCVHFWQIFKSSVLDSEAKKCRFFQTAGRTQLSKRLIVGKDKAAEKFLPESPSILLFCGL